MSPTDASGIVAVLKACAKQKNLVRGARLHADICKRDLLQKNQYIGNALVAMYVKCCEFTKALEMFDELSMRDVVSWNTLVTGYAQYGHCEEALKCIDWMVHEGLAPDAITFILVLKVCGSLGAVNMGVVVHAEIVRQELLENNPMLGTALLCMYCKCNVLADAQEVFDELPSRDAISWNVLIGGYVRYSYNTEAFSCFEQMQHEGFFPGVPILGGILNICGNIKAIERGESIHLEVIKYGYTEDYLTLTTALVNMYIKCSAFQEAQKVFDELHIRSVDTWSAIITGYVEHGYADEALKSFERMLGEGLTPDPAMLSCILKACGSIGAVDKGRKFHAEITRQGLLRKDVVLGTALVDMYARCGALEKAQHVFDELLVHDVVSWSALITGYSHYGYGEEAFSCYEWMQQEGFSPDAVISVSMLNVCGSLGAANKGSKVHAEIAKQGLMERDTVLGNALVDMYAKCGDFVKAEQAFDELVTPDVVSWNALITGYAQHAHDDEALSCFQEMQAEGFFPNRVTYIGVLKACGSARAVDKGHMMHAEIVKQGLLQTDVVLDTALLDMYVKCAALAEAQKVFDDLPVKNTVSWTALISGYGKSGHCKETLTWYGLMHEDGHFPDAATCTCILNACGSMGSNKIGILIHAEAVRHGFLKSESALGTAIVDMYAKCGAILAAQEVVDELPIQNVLSWSALISGYAQHGHEEKALNCLHQMKHMGIFPNSITFVSVLNACSHSGLLEECIMYFTSMKTYYGIIANEEHYSCMVDLFSRAGRFDNALGVIMGMDVLDCSTVWATLLGACQKSGDLKYGRLAFEHVIHLNDKHVAAYICMSNTTIAAKG